MTDDYAESLTGSGQEEDEAEGHEQIVMFELSGETYAVGLDVVQEVIRVAGIIQVPQTPGFIDGVINLRGHVVPVVDLKKRFGLAGSPPDKNSRIMIIDIDDDQIIGVLVDKALEVITIYDDDIEPPSALIVNTIKSDYLIGFTEANGELIKILDIGKVFSSRELDAMKNVE